MTLPTVIRVFFAIDLPFDVKEQIGRFISTIKKQSKTHAIRWTRPENLHITLHFLAEANIHDIPRLVESVKSEVLLLEKPANLQFDGLDLFPSPYRPRVIVLQMKEQKAVAELARAVGAGIKAAHYPVESRPFRPHLTLGRIKYNGINLNFLDQVPSPEMGSIGIEEVVLFRSEPDENGSKYTPIERIRFKQALMV